MSSHKQLWLAVVIFMAVLFVGTAAYSNLSAKNYLQQQLHRESINNASLIALSLQENIAANEPMQIQLPAQFDGTAFQLLQVADFAGAITAQRETPSKPPTSPAWFRTLFPIENSPAEARIVQAGTERGIVTLEADTAAAQQVLWQNTLQLAMLCGLALVVTGILGSLFLRHLLRPLGELIQQAEAFTGGNFITIAEPTTGEFKPAASAMNNLARSIGQQLALRKPAAKPVSKDLTTDKTTGLINREYFMTALKAGIKRCEGAGHGVVTLIHLNNLQRLNQMYGRQAVDELLAAMGHSLSSLCRQNNDWLAARLNGSDFALLVMQARDPMDIAMEAQAVLRGELDNRNMAAELHLPAATTSIGPGDRVKDMLTRIDGALCAAIAENKSHIYVAQQGDIQVKPVREQLIRWREIFSEAFTDLNFSLAAFPVSGLQGELLHLEAPARLRWNEQDMTAGQFLPWINRLDLAGDLDRQVVTLALKAIEKHRQPLSINLSRAALSDRSFLLWLCDHLQLDRVTAALLSLEVAESTVYAYLEEFIAFAARVKSLGIRMGVEHVGHRLGDIGRLREVDLDYIKIDGAFVRGIHQNRANQTIVRTLCDIGKSTGVTTIAEGVTNDEERSMLIDLGVDGITGPGVIMRGINEKGERVEGMVLRASEAFS